jgi:hypothetical protein
MGLHPDVTSNANLECFDAVYYSQQVPASLESLTLLGLVFDHLIFPDVYLPTSDFDEAALLEEIKRITSLRMRPTADDVAMLNCMGLALHVKYVRDFCIFTGTPGSMGGSEPESKPLMMALEELVFGPPPPGFIPTPSLGFCKGFHFSENVIEHQVNAPSWLAYPANALVYGTKHQIPVVNDSDLPVPGIPGSPKDNAKTLATILAIESIKLVLPKLKPLTPRALQEFRVETAKDVKPFRMSMLRLAKELNSALTADITLQEVQKHAQFLAETTVYPQLFELDALLNNPSKPWRKRVIDVAKKTPELITNFATMPKNLAVAKVLGALVSALADVRDDQIDKDQKLARSGLYYLLRIRRQ